MLVNSLTFFSSLPQGVKKQPGAPATSKFTLAGPPAPHGEQMAKPMGGNSKPGQSLSSMIILRGHFSTQRPQRVHFS